MLRELAETIESRHACRATHEKSVAHIERADGRVVWDGVVEVFALLGHPSANRAYAWFPPRSDPRSIVVVLEIPPVDSVESAVRAAIASRLGPLA